MSDKRIRCRLGFHDCAVTSETVTVLLSEGSYGKRERVYRIKRCIHCGKKDKDEILPPQSANLSTEKVDRILNPYMRRNRPP
ncbi:MAG: hypothetical protein OEM29_07075 [Thermoplasmata archaeon]|nr:hypothetical protein [Thermoplasmata archaeon]